jgi:hypothetical protein
VAGALGPVYGEADVAIEPHTGAESDLLSGVIEFGAISFWLVLGVPGPPAGAEFHRHPRGYFIRKESDSVQKVLALAWDDGGGATIEFTRVADGTAGRRPSAL